MDYRLNVGIHKNATISECVLQSKSSNLFPLVCSICLLWTAAIAELCWSKFLTGILLQVCSSLYPVSRWNRWAYNQSYHVLQGLYIQQTVYNQHYHELHDYWPWFAIHFKFCHPSDLFQPVVINRTFWASWCGLFHSHWIWPTLIV